jgi:hypothetical protein
MRRILLLVLMLTACAPPDNAVAPATEALTGAELLSFLRGRDLFLHEAFGGNGRTCSSCHLRRELGDNFDFTPEDAQTLFMSDPTDPLFRSLDAECGSGSDFSTLLNHGLVRIPFTLPSNVTVDEPDGCMVRTNPNGTRTVFVLRSTPTIENIALEESIMWDGRELANLAHQAGSAVNTHDQPGRQPTAQEQDDIAFFQRQFFTGFNTRIFAAGGPAPTLPTVPTGSSWDSARRGRNFFVDMAVEPGAPVRGGHCATCHSGPMLDTTNAFNPVQPAGIRAVQNNFVSEVNVVEFPPFPPGTRAGLGLPELTYHVTATSPVTSGGGIPFFGIPPGVPLFPAGTVFTIRTSDPGRILTTGDPCESPASCLINSVPPLGIFGTTSFFKTPTLWGTADTAPYFHDNSAEDLEDLLEHYQQALFAVTAVGTGNPAWNLTEQEEADIIAYMRFAFRRTTLL